MKVLLDTHTFLWAAIEPKKLSRKVHNLIAGEHWPLLSAASLWEIAIKIQTGKLREFSNPVETIEQALRDLKIAVLPVKGAHAMRTLLLPDYHKDPFDRMIVAQAMEEGIAIATTDDKIKQYPVEIFWSIRMGSFKAGRAHREPFFATHEGWSSSRIWSCRQNAAAS